MKVKKKKVKKYEISTLAIVPMKVPVHQVLPPESGLTPNEGIIFKFYDSLVHVQYHLSQKNINLQDMFCIQSTVSEALDDFDKTNPVMLKKFVEIVREQKRTGKR